MQLNCTIILHKNVMKKYDPDQLHLMAVIPGKLKSILKTLDHTFADRQALDNTTALLNREDIKFIIKTHSIELGIYEVVIMEGIRGFIEQDAERQKTTIFNRLDGFRAIAEGRPGKQFKSSIALTDELNRQNDSDYLKAIRIYLAIENPSLLKQYNEAFGKIISAVSREDDEQN